MAAQSTPALQATTPRGPSHLRDPRLVSRAPRASAPTQSQAQARVVDTAGDPAQALVQFRRVHHQATQAAPAQLQSRHLLLPQEATAASVQALALQLQSRLVLHPATRVAPARLQSRHLRQPDTQAVAQEAPSQSSQSLPPQHHRPTARAQAQAARLQLRSHQRRQHTLPSLMCTRQAPRPLHQQDTHLHRRATQHKRFESSLEFATQPHDLMTQRFQPSPDPFSHQRFPTKPLVLAYCLFVLLIPSQNTSPLIGYSGAASVSIRVLLLALRWGRSGLPWWSGRRQVDAARAFFGKYRLGWIVEKLFPLLCQWYCTWFDNGESCSLKNMSIKLFYTHGTEESALTCHSG